ncbi:MAG: PIN domain-containing protein [Deltaproteobacteria bacterium]|nr:MAG: PIN domain-containing protein [Deltaproteobacteria bacterium]
MAETKRAESTPILTDTSAWISFFRGDPKVVEQIKSLIRTDRIRISSLIIAELLQGARNDAELKDLAESMEAFPRFPEPPGIWDEAGKLSYRLRRKGVTLGLADCYLTVLAKINGAGIYTLDLNFKKIAKQEIKIECI